MTEHTSPSLIRRTIRFLFGSWAAKIYLLLVAAAAAFLAYNLATYDGEDGASFAGIYLILLTSPGVWLTFPISYGPEWAQPVVLLAGTAFGALLNCAAIGGLVHLVRRGNAPPTVAA